MTGLDMLECVRGSYTNVTKRMVSGKTSPSGISLPWIHWPQRERPHALAPPPTLPACLANICASDLVSGC